MEWPAALTTLLGAGGAGAIAARIVEHLLARRRHQAEASAQVQTAEITDHGHLRAELWHEIERLRARQDEVEHELNKSRVAYAELFGQHVQLKAEHQTLKQEHQELQAKYELVQLELDELRHR